MDYTPHSQESSSEVEGSRYPGSNPKYPLTGKSNAFLKPSAIKRKHFSSGSDSESDSDHEPASKRFRNVPEERTPHVRGAAAAAQLDRRSRKNLRPPSTDSDVDDPKRIKMAPNSDSEVDDRHLDRHLGEFGARAHRFTSTSDSEPDARNRLSVSSIDSATGDEDLSTTDHGQSDLEGKQLEENLAAGGWAEEAPRSASGSINDESTGDEESGVASGGSRLTHYSERSMSSTSTSTSYKYDLARPREETVYVDTKGQKMMEKMGYKCGEGLGKHGQGIVNPVEMSKQRGRRGFGHVVKGFEPANLMWDPKVEEIVVKEKVLWISEKNHDTLHIDFLESWITEGRKKLTVDDETEFCDKAILKEVLSSKTVFDELEGAELRKARTRSNPFEIIRNGIFLNRAAMKMANMDAICDFMFTRPKDEDNKPLVRDDELLYFADVCAGPGGFSEYVLYKKKWKAKGFGFTLRESNDFKLSDFYAGPPESFQPFYGVKTADGEEGDGDVYNPDNVQAFYEFVMSETKQKGVHFMMADGIFALINRDVVKSSDSAAGTAMSLRRDISESDIFSKVSKGFSVDGQENIQEILSKQLYLCQFLVALRIVRTGGNFVCKLFDLFTPFSVGLVYLMYKSFKQISLHKPNSSRPANSERYIICRWKREDCGGICDYMIRINSFLWKRRSSSGKEDIVEVVPLEVLKADREFFTYVCDSNNRIGRNQVIGLKKIKAFCQDISLEEYRQAELKKECLEFWEVENSARTAPPKSKKPDEYCISILRNSSDNSLTTRALHHQLKAIRPEDFSQRMNDPFEWHFAVLGFRKDGSQTKKESGLTFFLSLGSKKVFSLQKPSGKWMEERNIELAADTLILGEIVEELKGEHTSQVRTPTLHIVDAVRLGGIDVRNYVISERHRQCALFAEAMDKPSRTDLHRIQVKELFELEVAHEVIFSRQKTIKTKKYGMKVAFELKNSKFLLPGGLVFFQATQRPWGRTMSKTFRTKYYHAKGKQPIYENKTPPIHVAYKDVLKCHEDALIWWTDSDQDDGLTRETAWGEDLARYIHSKIF